MMGSQGQPCFSVMQNAALSRASCQSAYCQTLTLWYRRAQGCQRAAGAGAADLSGPSVPHPICSQDSCRQLQLQHAQGLHHKTNAIQDQIIA